MVPERFKNWVFRNAGRATAFICFLFISFLFLVADLLLWDSASKYSERLGLLGGKMLPLIILYWIPLAFLVLGFFLSYYLGYKQAREKWLAVGRRAGWQQREQIIRDQVEDYEAKQLKIENSIKACAQITIGPEATGIGAAYKNALDQALADRIFGMNDFVPKNIQFTKPDENDERIYTFQFSTVLAPSYFPESTYGDKFEILDRQITHCKLKFEMPNRKKKIEVKFRVEDKP